MSLFSEARAVIAGGVNSPVRAFAGVGGEPVFFRKAQGSWVETEDGRRLIDYVGSWGPMIHGHTHPDVIKVVCDTAANGLSFGAPCVLETAIANKITALMPSIEKVRMIDTNRESSASIEALKYTPGGAFGSARYKLKSLEENRAEYERLIEVFKAHDIGYFFYNGGNDSMDTAHKVSQLAKQMKFPLTCLGIPKTVDNDLPVTDNCPGFGSVAKYVAVSTQEAALDVVSMAKTSTKVFILEVMGRHGCNPPTA